MDMELLCIPAFRFLAPLRLPDLLQHEQENLIGPGTVVYKGFKASLVYMTKKNKEKKD